MSCKVTVNLLLTLESKFVFFVDLDMFTDHKHRCAQVQHTLIHIFQKKYEVLLYQKLQSEINVTPYVPSIEPCVTHNMCEKTL